MVHKQMFVWMYTHTHTHTKPCCLWLSCQRCLQWVSAFWRGIRKLMSKHELGTGRTPGTGRTCVKSAWASHPNGCWYLRLGILRSTTQFLAGLRCLIAQLKLAWVRCVSKSSVAASKYMMALRSLSRPTALSTRTITIFTAINNPYTEGLVA